MKNLLLFTLVLFICFTLKTKATLTAKTPEEKDLICITILKLAADKSKNAGEMIKYKKIIKLKKTYTGKYKENHFSEKIIQTKTNDHNLIIKEKGQRYINKNLQKCGLK